MKARRWALALGVTLLALAAGPAQADDYLVAPGQQITPVGENGGQGDEDGRATAMGGTFECSVDWATVANVPSGYAIGNCKRSVRLNRTWKSEDTPCCGYFDGGFISGNYNGCGWIGVNFSRKIAEGTFTACGSSASHALSEIAAYTDGCVGGEGCAGTRFNNPRSCPAYANYRPWSTNNRPVEKLRDIPAGATTAGGWRLAWRYMTRYASADGTGQYVMVHDYGSGGPGTGNWVFVPRSCTGL